MNMKKMMTTAAVATIIGWTRIVPSAYAEVSVMDVKCTPRNPWNGLVDIEYTIATDNPDADVYVNPVAYDGDRRITLFPSSFTGDGATNAVKAGKHTMVWDAKKDFGTFSSANFQIKIYAGERLARYVVIDLSGGNTSENYPVRLSHVGPDLSDDACRTTNLWLRLVPPGEFWMGSPEDELGRSDNEDLHHVTLTKPFYMGVFPVTIGQYTNVVSGWTHYENGTWSGATASPEFAGATNAVCRPVNGQVIFNSTSAGIRGLANPLAETGFAEHSFVGRIRSRVRNVAFDLPSEARWEYACRAGSLTALYNGQSQKDINLSTALGEIGAYYGNRYNGCSYNDSSVDIGTTVVGSYKPNALGLYDMLGNVREICRDGGLDNAHLGTCDVIDPQPCSTYSTGSYQIYYVARGGSWVDVAEKCRAASRFTSSNFYQFNAENIKNSGFRICAEADF